MTMEPGKELLWKYAQGMCEPHEVAFVNEWLKADPENQQKLKRIRLYTSIQESNGDSHVNDQEKLMEGKDEKPHSNYFLAFIIIILVFILFAIYSFLKN